jgi:hypothetical protein
MNAITYAQCYAEDSIIGFMKNDESSLTWIEFSESFVSSTEQIGSCHEVTDLTDTKTTEPRDLQILNVRY